LCFGTAITKTSSWPYRLARCKLLCLLCRSHCINRGQVFLQPTLSASLGTTPWLFGPVWTVLYAMMGISAWLVWRSGGFQTNRLALALFLAQLTLNSAWSWLFFAWQNGGLAFAEIVLLWLFIVATLVTFWRVRPLAGVLLMPYLFWVSFASVLNYSLWHNNPNILG